MCVLMFSIILCGFASTVSAQKLEIIDPAEAAKDPDFNFQGEYVGEGIWLDGEQVKVGAQMIAMGDGCFRVTLTKGGLPGDGWRRGDPRCFLQGGRQGDVVKLHPILIPSREMLGVFGTITGETMTIGDRYGKAKLELKRIVRHSPTEGAKPPASAVVLFDGTTADKFDKAKLTDDKNLMCGGTTKQGFGNYTLHVEFRLSYMPLARWQLRSNSGVYLHDCYEVQVLDSFGMDGKDDDCGGFYELRRPDVNMCYPPLTWQTYDVKFTAPKYQDGKKIVNARAEVRHNGVLIHPEFELAHNTPGRQGEGPAPRPIYLQAHGRDKVEYRNIWVKEN